MRVAQVAGRHDVAEAGDDEPLRPPGKKITGVGHGRSFFRVFLSDIRTAQWSSE
jgi:hypothetical protein